MEISIFRFSRIHLLSLQKKFYRLIIIPAYLFPSVFSLYLCFPQSRSLCSHRRPLCLFPFCSSSISFPRTYPGFTSRKHPYLCLPIHLESGPTFRWSSGNLWTGSRHIDLVSAQNLCTEPSFRECWLLMIPLESSVPAGLLW